MESSVPSEDRQRAAPSDNPRVAYRHQMLGLCTAGSSFYLAGRIVIPPLAVPIKDGFGIGNAEFGLALSILWAAYALMQFPGGVTSDATGHKAVLVGSMLISGVGFALLATGGTYEAFLVAALVTGVGGGLFMIVQFRFLSVLYGDNKGRAFGLSGGITGIAGVVAPIAATSIVGVASWRHPFAAMVVIVIAVALVLHVRVRERYVFERPALSAAVSRSIDQISSAKILLLMAITAIFSVAVQAVTTFIPLFMYEVKGLSLSMSGTMLSVYFLVAVVARPISGTLSDVVGRRTVAGSALVFSGVLLAYVVLVAKPFYALLVSFALFSWAIVSFSPAMDAYYMDLFADDSMGGAFGLARTFILFVGSTGPYLIGVGAETSGFANSFAIISGCLVLAGAMLLATTRAF
ncbi:MFS transporter (plasmid) [Halorarum halophilum]|uniref:MFS transporter n=1 Tax=Halorarum halophilum TaxID=2743090 RepID=A0A7D5KGL8_9EURY|nr:MFS transporter [Halobaculum halophilum]QLG29897.1 MFS transporter [Halobaculum halophilum]